MRQIRTIVVHHFHPGVYMGIITRARAVKYTGRMLRKRKCMRLSLFHRIFIQRRIPEHGDANTMLLHGLGT